MKNKPLVLMTHEISGDWIAGRLDDYRVIVGEKENRGIDKKLAPFLRQASGIFCLLDDPIPSEILLEAKNLKVVSNMAVGVDNIDLSTCTSLGIPVGHTPGVLTDGTADLTLALVLAVCRGIYQASTDAKEGRWKNWDPAGWLGVDLNETTVGIVGLGKIGSAVADRLKAFGARLVFTNRSPLPKMEKELNADQVSLDELLRTSDIVCLHVPLTPETRGLIDMGAFQKMKKNAVLINTSRGAVVDQQALLSALESGLIRGAGLDVTDPEPLPPDHPLYQLDNCLITPHIGSATYNTRKKMAEIAVSNLRAGINGDELLHCANPEVYS
jgi:glyoxylate reductase